MVTMNDGLIDESFTI